MQLPNNSGLSGYMTKGRLISLVIIVIMFFIYIALKLNMPPPPVETTPIGRYEDPYSGEIVTNNTDKVTPETYGVSEDEPTLLGISTLLDYGVTADQFSIFKIQLAKYAQINSFYEISVDVNNIKSELRADDSDTNSFVFQIITNRSGKHTAQLDCTGIGTARLRIFNEDKKVEFDSRTLTPAPVDAD